jgi:urease accessory protein
MKFALPRLALVSAVAPALAISLALFSPATFAHPGHGGAIADGILHPLTGVDHLLAMLGTGLWAAQQNARTRWLIPAAFTALMALAAWIATLGHSPAMTEYGAVASVLLIGLLTGFSVRTSSLAGMLIAGVFAAFHGFAHGTELPHASSGWLYGAGFLATSLALQAAGLCAGAQMKKHAWLSRAVGAGIGACGALLAFQNLASSAL